MIFVMSNGAILSCSPRFLNMSVKFCGASAMPTSRRLGAELQPLLQRMQGQTGQAADQSSVKPDVLQISSDGELDAADQHVDVPRLYLVGDEAPDAALLALHKVGKYTHHAAVDLGPDRRVARELAADVDQHDFELTADLAVGGPRILLQKGAQALPGAFGDGRDLGPRQQVALEALGAPRKGLRATQLLDESRHETVELHAQRMLAIGPRVLDEAAGGSDDLAQKIGVGPVEVEQRRQLLADPFAQCCQRLLVGQDFLQRAQKLVEQALVPALFGAGTRQARGQRRQLDALQLRHDALA